MAFKAIRGSMLLVSKQCTTFINTTISIAFIINYISLDPYEYHIGCRVYEF